MQYLLKMTISITSRIEDALFSMFHDYSKMFLNIVVLRCFFCIIFRFYAALRNPNLPRHRQSRNCLFDVSTSGLLSAAKLWHLWKFVQIELLFIIYFHKLGSGNFFSCALNTGTLAVSNPSDGNTMEVDQFASEWTYAGEGSRLPLIDESTALGTQAPKDRSPSMPFHC